MELESPQIASPCGLNPTSAKLQSSFSLFLSLDLDGHLCRDSPLDYLSLLLLWTIVAKDSAVCIVWSLTIPYRICHIFIFKHPLVPMKAAGIECEYVCRCVLVELLLSSKLLRDFKYYCFAQCSDLGHQRAPSFWTSVPKFQ